MHTLVYKRSSIVKTVLPDKHGLYFVYMNVYLLFGSGKSFSWTGARNGNFRKLGTEEEERRRARRPPSGLRWRDGMKNVAENS